MNLISVLGIRYISARIIVVFAARKLERRQLVSWPRNSSGHNCFSKDSGFSGAAELQDSGRAQIVLAPSSAVRPRTRKEYYCAPSGAEIRKRSRAHAFLRARPARDPGPGSIIICEVFGPGTLRKRAVDFHDTSIPAKIHACAALRLRRSF